MSADILRDLARVKAEFQLRAICAVIGADPCAMRASPDRAETTQIGSVGEADSTRSGEAGGAQDSARVRIGDGQ